MKSKIALAQVEACSDIEKNLNKAERMIREAAEGGAAMVVFPEIFIAAFPPDATLEEKLAAAQGINGPTVSRMREYARSNNIWVIFGMYEPVPEDLKSCVEANSVEETRAESSPVGTESESIAGKDKVSSCAKDSKGRSGTAPRNYNTTVVINGEGEVMSAYHKTHLYDAFSYRESDFNAAGDKFFEPMDSPVGRIGLMVCYEVRFPEIARYAALNSAQVIIMPTAWFSGKGKAEQLRISVQCRAMENTVFLALCDMCGDKRVGESALVGPLGEIIGEAGREETLLICEIDTDKIDEARKTLPLLDNRRPEMYI